MVSIRRRNRPLKQTDILSDNAVGSLGFGTNEARAISKYEDPAAYRAGSKAGLNKGFFAFDHIREDGRHLMMGMLLGCQDERVRNTLRPQGEWKHFVNDGGGEADRNMRHIATERHDGFELHVPLILGAGAYLRLANGQLLRIV